MTPAKQGKRLASEPYPRNYVKERAQLDTPMRKGEDGWSWAEPGVPLSKAERLANEQAGGKGYNPNPDPNPNPNPRPNPNHSPSASPISSPDPSPSPNANPIPKQAGGKAPKGGVWAECTNNEWTLSTPQMSIDVGVIGPFEEGYLREKVSARTINLIRSLS